MGTMPRVDPRGELRVEHLGLIASARLAPVSSNLTPSLGTGPLVKGNWHWQPLPFFLAGTWALEQACDN